MGKVHNSILLGVKGLGAGAGGAEFLLCSQGFCCLELKIGVTRSDPRINKTPGYKRAIWYGVNFSK